MTQTAAKIVRYTNLTTAELVRQADLPRISTTTRIQMLDEIVRREDEERAAAKDDRS